MQVTIHPLLNGGVPREKHVCAVYMCMLPMTLCVYVYFVLTVKEMKQPKRRGSTLLEMVPRRLTAIGSIGGSPKSPHKLILPKSPPNSRDFIMLADSLAAPGSSTSLDTEPSPELSRKEDTLSPPAVQKEGDQKEGKRWSVSDLPSLKLHGQDFPALVGMLEQVNYFYPLSHSISVMLFIPDQWNMFTAC